MQQPSIEQLLAVIATKDKEVYALNPEAVKSARVSPSMKSIFISIPNLPSSFRNLTTYQSFQKGTPRYVRKHREEPIVHVAGGRRTFVKLMYLEYPLSEDISEKLQLLNAQSKNILNSYVGFLD